MMEFVSWLMSLFFSRPNTGAAGGDHYNEPVIVYELVFWNVQPCRGWVSWLHLPDKRSTLVPQGVADCG